MSNHTPEPWELEIQRTHYYPEPFIIHKGKPVFRYNTWESSDDAKRAVACVNACAGMEDPEKEIEKLRADKQVLVDALEICRQGTERCSDTADIAYIAREALAKVREKEEG